MLPPIKAGSIWPAQAAAFARYDLGGDHLPSDRLAASQLPGPRCGPDDYAEPATAEIPAIDTDVDSVSSSRLSQVLAMHDTSHGSQVRSFSREPPRGDLDLGRGVDAHHDSISMGTYCAR